MPNADVLKAKQLHLEAEAAQCGAETRRANAEAAKLEAEAEVAALTAAKAKRVAAEELATDKYHHLYYFDSAVSDTTVEPCIKQLTEWNRLDPGCGMEIVFFGNPGGAIVAGMALFDFIQQLRRKGHHVTTSTLGMAASMAGILLQAGNTRVMAKESWLLIHEASFGAIGKIGEVEDTTDWVKRIMKRVKDIFADRSHLTVATIERKWRRKDWWIDSDEALELGLVDEVR